MEGWEAIGVSGMVICAKEMDIKVLQIHTYGALLGISYPGSVSSVLGSTISRVIHFEGSVSLPQYLPAPRICMVILSRKKD